MQIYTYKKGETIKEIAEKHGISEECLREANNLPFGEAAEGEELLILTPTRTHKLTPGDTIERLVLRFGVKRNDILTQNPWINDMGLVVGKTVNLKFDSKIYGTAPSNGYIYPNYNLQKLKVALPFLTYVTVGCAVADKEEIYYCYDDTKILSLIKNHRKIPLLRIYDKLAYRDISTEEKRKTFAEKIVQTAKLHDYMGVVLSTNNIAKEQKICGEFLCQLRKAMIGCDLILITEVESTTPVEICELADGNILFYQKHIKKPLLNYEDGELACYLNHAKFAESAKTFIDIPTLACGEKEFMPIEDAILAARKNNYTIETDENTLISVFQDKNKGRLLFPSLSNIKRTYDTINDLGYMGASFDICRTPIRQLLMYNACFRPAYQSSIRVVDGCNRVY